MSPGEVKRALSDNELVEAIAQLLRRAREPGAYDDSTYWELKYEVLAACEASYRALGDDIRAEDVAKMAREALAHVGRCRNGVLK